RGWSPSVPTTNGSGAAFLERQSRMASKLRGAIFRLVARDAFDDLVLGFLGTDPARHAHPLAGLEILVMLEEMRDLSRRDLGQVARRFNRPVEARQLVDRDGEDLG